MVYNNAERVHHTLILDQDDKREMLNGFEAPPAHVSIMNPFSVTKTAQLAFALIGIMTKETPAFKSIRKTSVNRVIAGMVFQRECMPNHMLISGFLAAAGLSFTLSSVCIYTEVSG